MVNQYYTKGLSLSNPGLVSFFFSLNLDFSLRDVFTTLARTVNFGEENIGKDSYLGSVHIGNYLGGIQCISFGGEKWFELA